MCMCGMFDWCLLGTACAGGRYTHAFAHGWQDRRPLKQASSCSAAIYCAKGGVAWQALGKAGWRAGGQTGEGRQAGRHAGRTTRNFELLGIWLHLLPAHVSPCQLPAPPHALHLIMKVCTTSPAPCLAPAPCSVSDGLVTGCEEFDPDIEDWKRGTIKYGTSFRRGHGVLCAPVPAGMPGGVCEESLHCGQVELQVLPLLWGAPL